jgi:hypothetical protein
MGWRDPQSRGSGIIAFHSFTRISLHRDSGSRIELPFAFFIWVNLAGMTFS